MLNVTNNTYKELLNTGKLYTLGPDSHTNAIVRYYTICEREEAYNRLNVDQLWHAIQLMEMGFGKLKIYHRENGEQVNLEDYPFYFDIKSDEYQKYQVALTYFRDGQGINMQKIEMLVEETNALKQQLKDILE